MRESLVIVDLLSREERFPHHDFYESQPWLSNALLSL